jgi:hypothetical protein
MFFYTHTNAQNNAQISQVLILFHTSHSAFDNKKVRFPKKGPFSIGQDGLQFDDTEYSSYFCGVNRITLKRFRL